VVIGKLGRALLPVMAFGLALTACSSKAADGAGQGTGAPAAATSVHPVSGLPVVGLAVTHLRTVHRFRVEVARTGPEQEKGLMFRTALGADEGMIFPMEAPRLASFWMKNTVIPLDILFIGFDRRIINIAANAIPYDETPLNSARPAIAVLELKGGRAAELGIATGDKVDW
jgi:uncharacterized membrane protein (UPF0127 family)